MTPAQAQVAAIVAGAGSSFAAGMRLLPPARRRAILALYAFCRVVDDIADGSARPAEKAAALDAWEAEIARVYAGAPCCGLGEELAHAVRAHDLPQEEFALIIEGMRMDVQGVVAPDPATFDRYVRCVAGAAGMLSMRIFGAWRGRRSAAFALSLARAMQIVNILRDVEEDAAMGRLYLPAPVLCAAGVPADPARAACHPRLPEARRLLGRRARTHFARAGRLARAHPWPRLLPALVMMGPYERLLHAMEADWAAPPPRRPGWRKAADGLACAARGLLCPGAPV